MGIYRVGIWGAGATGSEHLNAYLAQADCQVVAIGSLYRSDAAALGGRAGAGCVCYDDYEAFLAHPGLDVVSICTPHYLHAENTIAAVQQGKHVYVEKPIAVTLSDVYAIRKAVLASGVKAVTGFVLRWIPLVARLKELVRENALGQVRVIDVDFWHSRERPIEYRRRATGGSAMLIGGCHAIDTAMFLLDAYPVEVIARSTQIGDEPNNTYEFDCAELCLIRYSNGAVGRISAVVNGQMPYQFNIDILGDKGLVRNNRIFLEQDTEASGFRYLTEPGVESAKASGLPYAGVIRHLLQSVASNTEPAIGIEYMTRVHEVCFGALLSEHTGRPVPLPLGNRDQSEIKDLVEARPAQASLKEIADAPIQRRAEQETMNIDPDADDMPFQVVVNDQEQYSIWTADKAIPTGWRQVGVSGTKADCLAYIAQVWTDMRPASIRKRPALPDTQNEPQ
jgi:predicted dehydrogenase/uncharacterized protein YbdZ (MbtH family)